MTSIDELTPHEQQVWSATYAANFNALVRDYNCRGYGWPDEARREVYAEEARTMANWAVAALRVTEED